MQILIDSGAVLIGYILGSIPFGLFWVKLISGKDIRHIASGRTGGTNAARAAGAGAGVLTALMDIGKGAASVWIAQAITPGSHWVHVLAPVAAIMGHNYSIFLLERHTKGLRLRGGAGGGPAAGGAIGLWWPSALILLPTSLLMFFGIGYASVTTMSVALVSTVIFAVRYFTGVGPLVDIFYGVIAFCLLVWALRPNIKALREGRERFHGWRPWRKGPPPFSTRHEENPRPVQSTPPHQSARDARKPRSTKPSAARR
ncbi:MAG TPA: glycerol-3-phosphate acyltransferase [Anaerolineales bacterium]